MKVVCLGQVDCKLKASLAIVPSTLTYMRWTTAWPHVSQPPNHLFGRPLTVRGLKRETFELLSRVDDAMEGVILYKHF